MSISYSVDIIAMPAYATYNGVSDCVYELVWEMTGDDGALSAKYRGKTKVLADSGEAFIPYPDISPDIAAKWLSRSVDSKELNAARAYISNRILAQTAPTTADLPLPWKA